MLEVETIQTIHSSLTIATVIDVSFLLQIHRYCRVNIAINRQFDVLLQPYISSPTKGSRKFKSPKMDGSLCRQKKKASIRTCSTYRPKNSPSKWAYIYQATACSSLTNILICFLNLLNKLPTICSLPFILKKHQPLGT